MTRNQRTLRDMVLVLVLPALWALLVLSLAHAGDKILWVDTLRATSGDVTVKSPSGAVIAIFSSTGGTEITRDLHVKGATATDVLTVTGSSIACKVPLTGAFHVALPASAAIANIGTTTLATEGVFANSGVPYLAFDGAAAESACFLLRLSEAYDPALSLTVTARVAAAGVSQQQEWILQAATLTGEDLDTTAVSAMLDTAPADQQVTTSGTQGVTSAVTWTVANADLDAAAAGDWIVLQVARDALAAYDTSTADGYLIGLSVRQ